MDPKPVLEFLYELKNLTRRLNNLVEHEDASLQVWWDQLRYCTSEIDLLMKRGAARGQ